MKYYIVILLLMVSSVGLAADNDLHHETTKLKQVDSQIQRLKTALSRAGDKRKTYLKELAKIEKAISDTVNHLKKAEDSIKQQETKLAQLEEQVSVQAANIDKQQQQLSTQMRALYQYGRQNPLQLLLNQDNPQQLAGLLRYQDYINRYRFDYINKIRENIALLETQKQRVLQQKADLEQMRSKLRQQQAQLAKQQAQQQALIDSLAKSILTDKQKMKELQANRQSLTKLVKKIKSEQLLDQSSALSFDKMKGKLPWPVKGSIAKHFGEQVNESKLTFNGTLIDAPEKRAVRAIHAGRVVFSDWLRGFGLLIIIEHNNGYMSLYAHNRSLQKEVGESVNTGDIIASVGHSGGVPQSSLYLEVRHNGKPENPEKWMKGVLS